MNIMELGAIGELVGGVAVLVTLVYLAMQIRQNTRWVRSAAIDGHTQRAIDIHLRFAEPETARLGTAMAKGLDALEDKDRFRATSLFMAMQRGNQASFHQYKNGLLPEHVWHGFRVNIRTVIDNPSFQAFWQVRGPMFDPEFRRFVDQLSTEPAAVSLTDAVDPVEEA